MAWHNGEWWPIYVPQWYSPRVSQFPFDPYSFTHILHGFFIYLLIGWWPALVWGYVWWWEYLVGAGLAFLLELAHEVLENSEWMIRKYRQNSGSSALYNGDSIQNIVGDLLACEFGWYVSVMFVHLGVWWMILVWVVVTEVALLLYMRDSLFLILIQLTCPSQKIKEWTAAKVPPEGLPTEHQENDTLNK